MKKKEKPEQPVIYVKFQQSEFYFLGNINGKPFGLSISTNDGEQFDDGEGGGSELTSEEEDLIANSPQVAKEIDYACGRKRR